MCENVYKSLVPQRRLRIETFVQLKSVRTRGRNPLLSARFDPSFFLFSFARYAAINSDWRTHGALRGSRFKEGRNARVCLCLSLVNPNQNSQFMERVTYAAHLAIRCPNARKSDHPPTTSNRARDLLLDLASLPRFPAPCPFSPRRQR